MIDHLRIIHVKRYINKTSYFLNVLDTSSTITGSSTISTLLTSLFLRVHKVLSPSCRLIVPTHEVVKGKKCPQIRSVSMADPGMETYQLTTRCYCHCQHRTWEEPVLSIRSLSEVWRDNLGNFTLKSIDAKPGASQISSKTYLKLIQ